jgi:hypothetical protein
LHCYPILSHLSKNLTAKTLTFIADILPRRDAAELAVRGRLVIPGVSAWARNPGRSSAFTWPFPCGKAAP